jgi:uncharacterized UBP type Zn finger protein
MEDHSQNQNEGLEESMALAKQLEHEENEANRQVAMLENQINNAEGEEHHEGAHPEGESISSYVNQGYVQQLMEMGFSKLVAEKALFMNLAKQGDALGNALEWIDAHTDDPDFNEELKIVG